MIHDSLNNSGRIASLHPLFKQAFEYIQATDFSKQPDGKICLSGNRLTVCIATVTGKSETDAKLETHKHYIDIQFPLTGEETIGWKATSNLKVVATPYQKTNDIAFFQDRPTSLTHLTPGEFVIYFPEDAHAPCIGKGTIRKVVVKVEIEE